MLTKKILPVATPLLDSYSHYGSIFSILASDGDNYLPWLFSRFCQLIADPVKENRGLYINIDEPEWFPRTTSYCPLIETEILSTKIFERKYSIIEAVIDAINNNFYIFMVVEHYYIPGSTSYQKSSNNHDIMIYGYDKENQLLKIADNFNGKYKFCECTFSQFTEAYTHTNKDKNRLNSKVCLFSKKKNEVVEFDTMRLIDNLNSYLTGVYPEMRSSGWQSSFIGWAKGINIYNNVKEYLTLLLEKKTRVDKRTFYAIWEHKKLMVMRILYMQNNGLIKDSSSILEKYHEIERISYKHIMMLLKFEITSDPKLVQTIFLEIDSIISIETKLIQSILKNINIKPMNSSIILGIDMDHTRRWCLV
ncbi:hypothetical protein [Paenibacillus taichungensis]|uniref:hypothetical protein n=1 Tax=Paenibacillus taichungensis TaxID=484184 RepID=UPI0038CF3818